MHSAAGFVPASTNLPAQRRQLGCGGISLRRQVDVLTTILLGGRQKNVPRRWRRFWSTVAIIRAGTDVTIDERKQAKVTSVLDIFYVPSPY